MIEEKLGVGLCGGANKDGSLPAPALKRVLKLVELFKEDKINIILYTSGRTNRKKDGINEAEAMREETLRHGIPSPRIHCEIMSRDTYGNAAFSRALFIEPRGIKEFTVVTSAFHMPKSMILFNHVFPEFQGYIIKYVEVDDNGVDKESLKKRIESEKFSCDFYKKEILSETAAGNINEILKWHFEENPSHSLNMNKKWRRFTEVMETRFSDNPLY